MIDREFRFIFMPRSGGHAVIYWVLPMLTGETRYINNPPQGYVTLVKELDKSIEEYKRPGSERNIVYNHEFTYIDTFNKGSSLVKDARHREGPSRILRDILIVRDAQNYLASRIERYKKENKTKTISHYQEVMKVWKMHAREMLGMTKYLINDPIFVRFNKWFSSKSYRENLASNLELEFSDEWLNFVPRFGEGSSFDGQTYQGKAQEMKVLERWIQYKDDTLYQEIMSDKEIMELNRRLLNE